MGLFKVSIGPMGSSKSARAIADVKNLRYQGQKVLVLKPKLDDRDGDKIASRLINEYIQADIVLEPNERLGKQRIIEENYDCIVADEIHMLSVETIEDLYEISAVSDIEVHLYGLSMSWKGKPFLTTAIALAYADKIDKIEATDKQKNLLTHHIKKVDNMPCDITQEGGEIDTGDLGQEKYFTVSKQTFYNLYGMLGQLDKQVETKTVTTTSCINDLQTQSEICAKQRDFSLLGKVFPMVGHKVKLKPETCSLLCVKQLIGNIPLKECEGYIQEIVDNIAFIIKIRGITVAVYIDDFVVVIDDQLYTPFINYTAHRDKQGRYCHGDIRS